MGAMNLFHPTSYWSTDELEKMETDDERANAEFQAMEFGICPDVLFCTAHPQKLFEGEAREDSRLKDDALEAEVLLRDCLVAPSVAHTRLMEDSDDDEKQQPKHNGNRGAWEML